MSATMFARHEVTNYDRWKSVYDTIAGFRSEMGVIGASVHRDPQNPNIVVVTHKFESMDQAVAFANHENLKAGMKEAGVAGQPEFWFAEDVEYTDN